MTRDAGARRPFLTAEWRYLVMLNYEVPAALLQPLVPAGTVLDRWQGRALVSVVGFRFLRTRLLGVAVPGHVDFDEVNLRFYVRRDAPDGPRRGVTFVRELVPRRAIALAARLAYNEPYLAVPMTSTTPARPVEEPGRLRYGWRTAAGEQHVAATTVGAPAIPPAGSEAAFVVEHYWGYTRQRDGGTVEYQVTHPAWRTWRATDAELRVDAAGLYGTAFRDVLAGPPTSVVVAEGSPVTVHFPRRLGGWDARKSKSSIDDSG